MQFVPKLTLQSTSRPTLELRGGAHNLETTQVSRMRAALFAVPSSDCVPSMFYSLRGASPLSNHDGGEG